MISKYIRRNTPNLLLLIILFFLIFVFLNKNIISTDDALLFTHVDLLTINSIFIGFLFTTLGVIVGFLSNKRIVNLDRSGYMDEYYNTIYFGLFFFIISTICGILGIFINTLEQNQKLILTEQISIIIGISFFIKAIINLATIIRRVRESL